MYVCRAVTKRSHRCADVRDAQYGGGTRATSVALRQAARDVLTTRRDGVPLAVVVLLAGPSDNPTSAAVTARLLVAQSGASALYVLGEPSKTSHLPTPRSVCSFHCLTSS